MTNIKDFLEDEKDCADMLGVSVEEYRKDLKNVKLSTKEIKSDNYLVNCYKNLLRSKSLYFIFILIEMVLNIIEELETFIDGFNSQTSQNKLNYISYITNKFDKKAIPHDDYLFLANISSNFDLQKVCDYGFDGVGLYRTEMIFMNSDRPYTFLEQYQIYSEAVDALGENRFICFRTFDVGDDKKISYLNTKKKGIDNYIRNPEIFETQISAIMKANKYKNVRLMFPMITSNSEFEYLRDWVLRVAKKNGYNTPLIGMMLETKSALMNIDTFVKADFISIGTNDLTKELYDINRDMSISEIDKYLSKLLIDIKSVVDFCNKMNNGGIS